MGQEAAARPPSPRRTGRGAPAGAAPVIPARRPRPAGSGPSRRREREGRRRLRAAHRCRDGGPAHRHPVLPRLAGQVGRGQPHLRTHRPEHLGDRGDLVVAAAGRADRTARPASRDRLRSGPAAVTSVMEAPPVGRSLAAGWSVMGAASRSAGALRAGARRPRRTGREPKNPRDADSGEGWTRLHRGRAPQPRPGPRRVGTPQHRHQRAVPCASARIACSVTASQPRPRWEPGSPGRRSGTGSAA